MLRIRTQRVALVGALVVALAAPLSLGGASAPAPAQDAASRWSTRLEKLDPLRPLDYFELAEEVADAAAGDDDRALARRLFGLAGALDTRNLGRSAMLALASLADSQSERVRALAAAELVGGGGAAGRGGDGAIAQPIRERDAQQLDGLVRAFAFHRRGDGRRALSALRQGDADALLELVGPALPGGAEAFRVECRAMRSGAPLPNDPDLADRQRLIELALRRADARSASLDLALHGDAPLPEIDLSDPALTWGVDPSRAWWRQGSWRASPQ